jgi:hypothetical protein
MVTGSIDTPTCWYYCLNFYQQTSLRINYGYARLFIVGKNTCKIQVLNKTLNFLIFDPNSSTGLEGAGCCPNPLSGHLKVFFYYGIQKIQADVVTPE